MRGAHGGERFMRGEVAVRPEFLVPSAPDDEFARRTLRDGIAHDRDHFREAARAAQVEIIVPASEPDEVGMRMRSGLQGSEMTSPTRGPVAAD